jgi:hypothetical protein
LHDHVPLAVVRVAVRHLDLSVGFLWDAGFDLPFGNGIAQPVGGIAFVCQQHLRGWQGSRQCCGTGVNTDLTVRLATAFREFHEDAAKHTQSRQRTKRL